MAQGKDDRDMALITAQMANVHVQEMDQSDDYVYVVSFTYIYFLA